MRLQVLPAGAAPGSAEKILEFTRNKVTLEAQAAHKEVKTVVRNGRTLKIGVITVPGFYQDIAAENPGDPEQPQHHARRAPSCSTELKAENVDGIVLDLRNDGGGYLPEATALTGLFIDHGPVVQLRDTTGRLEVLDDPEKGAAYAGPLTVLVDRLSASASEIFAGAIQDYHRGLILGQTTFGKGTVQNLVRLDRWSPEPVNGQLTVTIGKFYRVTGESTQHRGVVPDVHARLGPRHQGNRRECAGVGAALGPHPRRAVQGSSAEAARAATGEPCQRGKRARRARPGLRAGWSDIAALDEVREQKTVSLNLKTRREESARGSTRSAWSARTAGAWRRTCRRSRRSRSWTSPRTPPIRCSTRPRRSWRTWSPACAQGPGQKTAQSN